MMVSENHHQRNREKTIGQTTTIGLDLAKNVFHVVCCDNRGKLIGRKMLKRSHVLNYFANFSACLVGVEACASAHYWARELGALGHQVKLNRPGISRHSRAV